MKSFAKLGLVIGLAACHWVTPTDNTAIAATSAAPAPKPTRIAFIGNSLTLHPESKELGWMNHWGMAASAQARDYAHLTGAALKLPVSVVNLSNLELDPVTNAGRLAEVAPRIDATTLVVVELGDNVRAAHLASFTEIYAKLVATAAQGLRLVCLSTWWRNPSTDAVIRQQCTSHGGRYVDIGDIHADPASQDRQRTQFANPSVNAHPHDWGMARIAERVAAALR
ncbi:SGNH/GDSL hydrolase family protein [Variovorax rhizosphaerae]|uniref:SGNH/GDSL hydrolase family protein n=1 Tax=Variovorax rhizosphaerae TaxID=1836200 RepID=A0ABU8WKH0_9BURK